MKGLIKKGEFFIWLTGLGLGISIVMIAGLLFLIVSKSTDYYYPKALVKIDRKDNFTILGQEFRSEEIPHSAPSKSSKLFSKQIKIGNRDIYGYDFLWIDESDILSVKYPKEAVVIERAEYGNFYGVIKAVLINGNIKYSTSAEIKNRLQALINKVSSYRKEIRDIELDDIGKINNEIEGFRLDIKKFEYESSKSHKDFGKEISDRNQKIAEKEKLYSNLIYQIDSLKKVVQKYSLLVQTADEREIEIPMINIIRVYYPNEMSFISKINFIITKLWELISEDPRESNTEGGVFPAIFGTVMLVFIMSFLVLPLGVLAALYLREYARQGLFVRIVRIAVNNLAGVPSIVFGVFGLGFFVYFLGGTIDQIFYPERLPNPTWGTGGILWASLTLALLTLPVVIVSTEEALAAIPRSFREASLALGATKWQTLWHVIIPSATPGILTGMILAMARAAGEVAPLMITGVVKLAPNLPMDSSFPFFHLDRKFMHLGFHIYDVGFQSPNIEAALPMVYVTTLLLISIVILLNLSAIILRAKLRKKYQSSTF